MIKCISGNTLRRLLGIRLGRFQQYAPRELTHISLPPINETVLPSITLVTPSYNQGQFIGATIESVVNQNYPNLQYIIQDSVSQDTTPAILEKYKKSGIAIHIEKDSGQTDALNRGFQKSTGEIMGYLNSDDMLMPGTLNFIGNFFATHPDVDVIYGNRLIVDEVGQEIGRWILPYHDSRVMRFIDYIPQETMFWRRRVWDRIGGNFDTQFSFAMDWNIIVRFLNAGAVFHHESYLFGIFRAHDQQKSQAAYHSLGKHEIRLLHRQGNSMNISIISDLWAHIRFLYQHRVADARFQKQYSANIG
jgi:glycosyltransferase involved in cell wall biosynthesis